MKTAQTKQLLLEQLKKAPIVQVACEKIGISRATFYRWRRASSKFAKQVDTAISEGEALINDLSESQLFSLIKEKNFAAIRFWLSHRNEKFRQKVDVNLQLPEEKLTPEQEAAVKEALKLAACVQTNSPNYGK